MSSDSLNYEDLLEIERRLRSMAVYATTPWIHHQPATIFGLFPGERVLLSFPSGMKPEDREYVVGILVSDLENVVISNGYRRWRLTPEQAGDLWYARIYPVPKNETDERTV